MKKIILFVAACMMYILNAHATVRTASVSGNWSTPATWGGTVPNANDDVMINSGVIVTINVNPNTIMNVAISGTLQWDATGTGRTWTVAGSFTINSSGTFNCLAPGSATTHTWTYNGTSFTNNGTFNMVNSTNKCNVVIGGSTTQTFSGSNALAFNKLTLLNTGGKFSIDYASTFTPSEINPTKFNLSIITNDSLVVKQGLMVLCASNNSTLTHTIANLRMGSGTSRIASSVNIFSGVATFTMNTCIVVNDATNANVTFTVTGSFTSPNMSAANSAIAFAILGPNCQGGSNNATSCSIGGEMYIPDLFGFVANSKLFGGTEPKRPDFTLNGNVYWQYSKSHTLDIPFTSNDILIKTFFFGLFDSIGTHPRFILNGGTVSTPNTFNIPFSVFNAPIQYSDPPGDPVIAQISESAADWQVNGNWKILTGASMAVHPDDTLQVNGSLRVQTNGEIAGSETETDSTGYVPTNGPLLQLASSATLYVENTAGLGKGTLADSTQNVAIKNRTADRSWNLSTITSNGTIDYTGNGTQTITNRTYNNLATSTQGTKTLANNITVNGSTTIGSATTLGNGGYTATLKGAVTNNGTHSGTGKIILGGASNQSLSGTGSEWGNVQLNNSAGAACASNVSSSGTIDFTNGILTTTSSAKLSLTSAGNYTGGSSTSYVNGPMSKTTASTAEFIFPVGKGGNMRQASILPSSSSSTTWTVEYFNSAYSNTTSVLAPIASVSNLLYWTVDRNGSSSGHVRLFWGSEAGLPDVIGLTVARFNGAQWTDAGDSTITGSATSGTIGSDVVSTFSPFTLGELAVANTISTGSISGSPFCPGANVSVPFTSTGTFNAGNIYTAQISNKSGSFSAPVAMGTLSSTANAGTISATIPTTSKGGTKYRIRVVSSNPIVTGSANTTNLAVTACGAPADIHTTATTSTTASFNWSAITCAYSYTLEYRVQGTSTWKKKKNLPGLTYTLTGLTANTTYEYAIQTFCTSDNKSKSSFTATQTFTTTLRLSSGITSTEQSVVMYPNPATDNVELSIISNENNSGTIKIFNAVGQVVMEEMISLNDGSNQLSIDVSSLTAGIYFVEVRNGDVRGMEKLVKE